MEDIKFLMAYVAVVSVMAFGIISISIYGNGKLAEDKLEEQKVYCEFGGEALCEKYLEYEYVGRV